MSGSIFGNQIGTILLNLDLVSEQRRVTCGARDISVAVTLARVWQKLNFQFFVFEFLGEKS